MKEYLHLLELLVLFVVVFPLIWVHARLLQRFLFMTGEIFLEKLMNKFHILQSAINMYNVMGNDQGTKSFFPWQRFVS